MCTGQLLDPNVQLLSLKLFKLPGNVLLASANIMKHSCVTFGDYVSCYVDSENTHRSSVKTLVVDLEEGESRSYGCNVTTMNSLGYTKALTWTTFVTRKSKKIHSCK